ncbi:MAG: cardiolipin synthase [Elusimicrobia bacterium]|jgi:cardiolipin synthase|nr:cardiolipin synthase [Elusimicrobiota bacterium]
MIDFVLSGWGLLTLLDMTLALLFSFFVISRKRDAAVTLAWVLGFFLIPFLGVTLYSFFGFQRFRLRRRRVPKPSHRLFQREDPSHLKESLPHALQNVALLASKLTEYPVVGGNRVTLFDRATETDTALAQSIRQAKHHVHMCYYNVEPDQTGLFFRDLLIEQARRGIVCRLLIDAVGSFRIGRSFLKPLQEAGVHTAVFSPFRTFRRPWSFNFRNHRKLTVIDGSSGFMGSQNIGHHFWRVGSRRLHWRETDVRLEGPAAEGLQAVFVEDWNFVTGEHLSGENYFPLPSQKGSTLVQVLPTGPDRQENALGMIFLEAIHAARERVTITTPYFIPTPPVALALKIAARKGVRVELLLPKKTDHPVVDLASRSWFKEFLQSGVHLYQLREGFLHSKVVTVDGQLALVGSANMDTRSFLINFELSLLLYDREVAGHLLHVFDRMTDHATVVKHDELSDLSFTRQFTEGFCRALSPLL